MPHQRSVVLLLAAVVSRPIAAQTTPFEQAKEHLAKARSLAGMEFISTEEVQCHELGEGDPYHSTEKGKEVKPTAVFDNLFYIGTTTVGAWALKTSAGIILVNSLPTEELKSTLLPGMKKVGLDPAQVKYVIVTQARGDHYGGAKYFQGQYNAQVIMSAADWDAMSRLPVPSGRGAARGDTTVGSGRRGGGGGGSGGGRGGFGGGRGGGRGGGGFGGGRESTAKRRPEPEPVDDAPRRDQVAIDGLTVTLGDETVTIVSTPGTTPGALAVLVPVVDHGTAHVAAIVGATEIPSTDDAKHAYIASATHLGQLAATHHVDAELTSYPFVDNAAARMDTLRRTESKDAKLSVKNPFVIGEDGFQRFIGVIGECGWVELLYPFRRADLPQHEPRG